MSLSSPLHCGTSGWAFPHWDGVVYPRPRPRLFHELERLARFFDTVEIPAGSPPKPEITRLWIHRVSSNPNFLFTARLPRRFTYDRNLDAAEVEAFKEGLRPLAQVGKLGCLVMQFPWSFRFTRENRDFFIQLRRTFHEFPLVAEMRHSSWMLDEALGTFVDYHVGFANIDQPQFMKAMPPTAFLTSPIGYVRLEGRNHPERFREFDEVDDPARPQDYYYTQAELQDWTARIERIRTYAKRTFVVLCNDGDGKAVVNGLQLQHLLDRQRPLAPRPLLAAYREELRGFLAEGPKQESLFTMPAAPHTARPTAPSILQPRSRRAVA